MENMKLNIKKLLPLEFKNIPLSQLHDLLEGPTLFHLQGQSEDCVFLSTLLHGNETSGFLAIQEIFDYISNNPKRSILLFIGNTFAAQQGLRHLDGQPDYNRIWKGGALPEHNLAGQVIEHVKQYEIFASVDIHNNTGKNPLYGCVNLLQETYIKLASLFGSHIVYFTEPHNVLSNTFSQFAPSVTIEAGLPGKREGIDAIKEYVKKVVELKSFDEIQIPQGKEVYQSLARILVDESAVIDYQDNQNFDGDISFISNIDERNFHVLPRNTHLGYINDFSKIKVVNSNGEDVTGEYLKKVGGELLTNRMFMPSMFTKEIRVVKSDCLGYINESVEPRFFL